MGCEYVHACVSGSGVPPVQPAGEDVSTVRVCVPSGWHAPQLEYVNDVQAVTGGVDVHACVSGPGEPPVQPAGEDVITVRVCVPPGWQAPQLEYVNDVQVAGFGGGSTQGWTSCDVPVQPSGVDETTVRDCVPSA